MLVLLFVVLLFCGVFCEAVCFVSYLVLFCSFFFFFFCLFFFFFFFFVVVVFVWVFFFSLFSFAITALVLCLTLCYFVFVFFSRFSIAIISLWEERANLGAFLYVCQICAYLVLSVFSSSRCLGRAAACDYGTPWTFLLPFFIILRSDLF